MQNFNIGQRSPLFDKFQPKCPAPLLPVQTSTDAFRRYKELAGLSVMQPPLALGPLCLPTPTKSYLLQCVITFKDRSLDLIAPHAHGLAALMLVNDAHSAPSPYACACVARLPVTLVYRWCVGWASCRCLPTLLAKLFTTLRPALLNRLSASCSPRQVKARCRCCA